MPKISRSSSEVSSVFCKFMFSQIPLHSLQAGVQSRPSRLNPQRFLHPVLHLHLTTSSWEFGATSKSVIRGNIFFDDLPPRFSAFNLWPFHAWTWWKTRKLCYFNAPEVGGNDLGWVSFLLLATDSWNLWCLSESRFSSSFAFYTQSIAFSPAFIISSSLESQLPNTLVRSRKYSLSYANFSAIPFPQPKTREVVSQPRNAWTKRMLLQRSSPSFWHTRPMFRSLSFLPFLGSSLQKRLYFTLVVW